FRSKHNPDILRSSMLYLFSLTMVWLLPIFQHAGRLLPRSPILSSHHLFPSNLLQHRLHKLTAITRTKRKKWLTIFSYVHTLLFLQSDCIFKSRFNVYPITEQ